MSDRPILLLDPLLEAALGDFLEIVDVSEPILSKKNKKISLQNLKAAIGAAATWGNIGGAISDQTDLGQRLAQFYTKAATDLLLDDKADLGPDGKILAAQMPYIPTGNIFYVGSEAEMLDLGNTKLNQPIPARGGDFAIRTDIQQRFELMGSNASILANWVPVTSNVTDTDDVPEGVNPARRYYTDARARNAFIENITGITYNPVDGTWTLDSGYVIPTQTQLNSYLTADDIAGLATTAYVNSVRDQILGGASAAYDTLLEIENYIQADQTGTAALVTAINNRYTKTESDGRYLQLGGDPQTVTKEVTFDAPIYQTLNSQIITDNTTLITGAVSTANTPDPVRPTIQLSSDATANTTFDIITKDNGIVLAGSRDGASYVQALLRPGTNEIIAFLSDLEGLGGGGISTISQATDYDNSTPATDGQLLRFIQATGKFTPFTLPSPYTDEKAQDAVGDILNTDEFTYNDVTPNISINKVPYSKVTGVPDATYYVSNTGLEANSGKSEASPINLTKLNTLLATFQGGETVAFKSGETFEGQLTISTGGLPKRPISFTSFGKGAAPVIEGSVNITAQTWTNEGSSVYSTSVAQAVNAIFISGIEAKEAQTDWIQATGKPAANQITAAAIGTYPAGSLVGARVLSKDYGFRYGANVVTAHVGNTITLQNPSELAANNYFRLLGQRQFITETGEWAYEGGKVYYRTASGVPTNIRAGIYACGLKINAGCHNIRVDNLQFQRQYFDAIQANECQNLQIDSCLFQDIVKCAVSNQGQINGFKFENSIVRRVGYIGVLLNEPQYFRLFNNTFDTIGMGANYPIYREYQGTATMGVAVATVQNARYGVVDKNRVYSCAYNGLHIYGSHHTITRNRIHSFCLRLNDGGGIYMWSQPAFGEDNTNVLIANNVVSGGVGNIEFISGSPVHTAGIYIDNGCYNFTLRSNVCYDNSTSGILLNFDTLQNKVFYNICWNNAKDQILFTNDTTNGLSYNNGNQMKGNIMACKSPTQNCLTIQSFTGETNFNPFASGGSSDFNQFINPYTTSIVRYKPTFGSAGTAYSLATWRTLYNTDANSRISPVAFSYNVANVDNEIGFYVNEEEYASVFNIREGFTDLDQNATTSFLLEGFGAQVVLKKGTSQVFTEIFRDTFSGPNGQALTARTPEVGTYGAIGTTGTQDGAGNYTIADNNSFFQINQHTLDMEATLTITNATTGGLRFDMRRQAGFTSLVYFTLTLSGTTLTPSLSDYYAGVDHVQTAPSIPLPAYPFTAKFKLIGTQATIQINANTPSVFTISNNTTDGAVYLLGSAANWKVSEVSLKSITEGAGLGNLYRNPGWSLPTGTLSRATFDPATVSQLQVAQTLAALVADFYTNNQLLRT